MECQYRFSTNSFLNTAPNNLLETLFYICYDEGALFKKNAFIEHLIS